VVPELKAKGLSLSIDSFAAEVQRWALKQDVDYVNDIHGFPDPSLYPELAQSRAKLIVMHMVQPRGVAVRTDVPSAEIFDRVTAFFDTRIRAATSPTVRNGGSIMSPRR